MLTFLFLNKTLWCDHSLESSRRDDFNEGYIIGFGWEMRKLSWKQFRSLFLNCSPAWWSITFFSLIENLLVMKLFLLHLDKCYAILVIAPRNLQHSVINRGDLLLLVNLFQLGYWFTCISILRCCKQAGAKIRALIQLQVSTLFLKKKILPKINFSKLVQTNFS